MNATPSPSLSTGISKMPFPVIKQKNLGSSPVRTGKSPFSLKFNLWLLSQNTPLDVPIKKNKRTYFVKDVDCSGQMVVVGLCKHVSQALDHFLHYC